MVRAPEMLPGLRCLGERTMGELPGFAEALGVVLEHAAGLRPRGSEWVRLEASRGRVVAEALVADRDQPPFDRSTRDGFAMAAGDARRRRVLGMVAAGGVWTGAALGTRNAVEIMTGAPMPAGADAVVMVEHAARVGDDVVIDATREPVAGQNVVPRGAELRAGAEAMAAGARMGAAEIAVAASVGAAEVRVYARPRVAILATGDELVELREACAPQQIRNSNSYALAALVEEAGGEAMRLPVVRDTREDLRAALAVAMAEADLLLLSGGVSAGKYDLVEDVLAELGAEFFFTGVKMQPGKPVVFGSVARGEERGALAFFGLPGNPVSTQVTFACFVAPLLRLLGGEAAAAPRFVKALLAEEVAARPGLTRVLPATISGGLERTTVRLVAWQGSGDQAANARGNGYAVLPDRAEGFAVGELISVLLR